MATEYNLYIDQGTTFTEQINVANLDLSSATITSMLRSDYDSTTPISFTITPISLVNGQFTLSLTATQTAALEAGRYVYDVKYSIGSSVARIVEGLVVVNPSVTY